MRLKIVITDFLTGPLDVEQRILGDLAEICALDATDEDQLAGRVEDADAMMVYHNLTVTRTTIERLERCRLIVRCGVGFDNVEHAFARTRNIPVANIPDYGTEDVADSAIALTLALTRGVTFHNSRLRANVGPWSYAEAAPLQRLRGGVFAIAGLGRIGTAAALRAKAMGMDVCFYDPHKPDGYDKSLGVRRVETLEQLLGEAYVLSLHTPLTQETRFMINAEALTHMPRGSYLVNTSRGAVVQTDAIPDAIASGQLAGAGIDVLPEEPPADDDPLITAWRNTSHPAHHRVVINPHCAFYCEQALLDIRTRGAQACRNAVLGQPIHNIVNAG